MKLIKTVFDAVHWFERPLHEDERGGFSRLFCAQILVELGLNAQVVQMNHATNCLAGTLRGMHFQYPPGAETKTVSCVSGAVFDVVVDLRKQSPTCFQWHSFELAANRPSVLIIPPGFAHGYLTLQDDSQLIYTHSASYQPELEAALRYDDPALAIHWPSQVKVISKRDLNHALMGDDFQGIQL